MMDDRLEFRNYVKAAGANFDVPQGECPTEAELAEYCRKAVDEDRAENIQRHLVRCGACRQTVVDLADFLDPAPSAADLNQEWGRLRRSLAPKRPGIVRYFSFDWKPAAAAVALASLCAVGAFVVTKRHYESREALLIAQLGQRESEKSPALNPMLIDLLPRDAITRSGVNTVITISAGDKPVVLILNAAGQPEHAQYFIEIMTREGRAVWQGAGLRRIQGSYVITFPPRFLPPGQYTIRVSAAGTTVAEYALAIS